MITRDHLKQIVMLSYLTDEMIDALIPITEMLRFEDKEYIFRQGDDADRLYMLFQGKVLLEQLIAPQITVSLSAIKPGFSFGWSAVLDEGHYTSDALCAEASQLFSIRSDKLISLFEKDHSLGFILSQRLLRVIKKRYDTCHEQFIKVIRHHPDLSELL